MGHRNWPEGANSVPPPISTLVVLDSTASQYYDPAMTEHSIEVDAEIFQLLQQQARPFIDTPNDVLRRLLLSPAEEPNGRKFLATQGPVYPMPASSQPPVPVEAFVREIISKQFGVGFRRVAPYRMMFQDGDRLIYFQNFNKAAAHLWFRITPRPWKSLRAKAKSAWVCFTNPAERYAYLIPVADVIERVHRSGWSRDYLEVNIDPGSSQWTELNWDLSEYRKLFGRGA